MSFLIDTSLLLGAGNPEAIADWAVSRVTIGEIQVGVLMAASAVERSERLAILSSVLDETGGVIDVGVEVASAYAEVRAASGRQPSNDLWIAATAIAHDLELVTADRRMASLPGVRARLVA